MVALRKDVKVGLAIGAIAVSVIGVYAGLSALAGEKPAANGATLATTPIDLAAKPSLEKPAVVTGLGNVTPGVNGSARTGQSATPPDTASAQPNQALAIPQPTDSADPWSVAFGSGNVPPAVTQQPAPGQKTNTPADQKETIEAIQGKNNVASANDGSGSLANNGTPTLVGGTTTSGASTGNFTGGATTQPAGPEKTHTIEPGETFVSIANEYYGDGNQFAAIVAANPQVNPNKLKPGTVIKIPALAKKEARSDTVDVPAAAGSTGKSIDPAKQYVVKSGDSLHKIASTLYGDSAMSSKIYDLNKNVIGSDPTRIKIGMVLNLPSPPTKK